MVSTVALTRSTTQKKMPERIEWIWLSVFSDSHSLPQFPFGTSEQKNRWLTFCNLDARVEAAWTWHRKNKNPLSGDLMKVFFFFEANIGGFLNFFSWVKMASCSTAQDNMLTGAFSSTIRSGLGSQFVLEKLSIAFLF